MSYKLRFAVLVVIGALWPFSFAHASYVVSSNITELMALANVAFTGKCTGVEAHMQKPYGKGNGIPVTTYIFAVLPDGVIKDPGGVIKDNVFKFTQFGMPEVDALRFGIKGNVKAVTTVYEKEKEYTLFLSSESPAGLRAPISIGYGKFNITTDKSGGKNVVNDYGNKGLFKNIPPGKSMKIFKAAGISGPAPAEGPMDYNVFMKMLKGLKTGE